jgi:hypothetical protein
MEKNPAEFWYKGEIGFFDYYIVSISILVARVLKRTKIALTG